MEELNEDFNEDFSQEGIQDSIDAISQYLNSKGAYDAQVFGDGSVLVHNDSDPDNNEVFDGPELFALAVLTEIAE